MILQKKIMDRNKNFNSNPLNYSSYSSQINQYNNLESPYGKSLNNVNRNQSVNKNIEGNYSSTLNNMEKETKIQSNLNTYQESNLKVNTYDSTSYSSNKLNGKFNSNTETIRSTPQTRNSSVPHKPSTISHQENKFIVCTCNYLNYSSKSLCEKCGSMLDPSRIVTRSNLDNYNNKNSIPLGSSLNKMMTNNSNNSLNSSISNLSSNKLKSIPTSSYTSNTSAKGSNLTSNANKKSHEWICVFCKQFNRKSEEFCESCQRGNSNITGNRDSKYPTSSFKQNNSLTTSNLNLRPTTSNQNYNNSFRNGSNLSNPLSNYENKQKSQVAVKPTYLSNNYNQNTQDMRRSVNPDLNYIKSSNGMYSNPSNFGNQSNQSSQNYLYNGGSSIGRNLSMDKNILTRSRSVKR
jgi:hypothetical protein